jgi:tetratricopeptide (TPR) repeat protein
LFARLAKAQDEAEAGGVAGRIGRLLGRSASDTSNILMARAMFAVSKDEPTLGEDLLDRILDLDPGWAEAWNRRAGLRFKRGDISGAMTDLAETLKREPRHYGALSGLGFALLQLDRKAEALRAFDKALAVHPFHEPTRKVAEKLHAELDGQAL